MTTDYTNGTRTSMQVLESVAQLLEESLAVQRHLLARFSEAAETAGARSSVQLEQGAKEVRLTVKLYDGSPIGTLGDEALAEFGRLFRALEERQREAWSETVAAVTA